ncbi:MAG: 3-dehydroquinate synthase [Acidimicrobiales bacterium]
MQGNTAVVHVELGDRGYPVLVGSGVLDELASLVPPGVQRVAVVTQDSINVGVDPGVEHRLFLIDEGEPAKSLSTVEDLCRAWAQWGLTRGDVVVAVGGGLVTDVGGFAASVYHRGIPFISVATTLVGQIDAAIGGKTGVNLAVGKNLVGTFWQPTAVVCDTDVLATLPEREWRCGFGEMAKYELLGAGNLRELTLQEQIVHCVQMKATVVAADEREGGGRAVLNYGHTLAHALEVSGSFDLRHGEAVAVGLVYAAEVARRLDRIDRDRVEEHRNVVGHYELNDRLPPGTDIDRTLELFAHDKKAVLGITLVLDGPDGFEPVVAPDETLLRAALEALS